MKKCLVVPLVGLAISFALPIYAQQMDLADPQTSQRILALAKAFDEAHVNNDAAAVAALFTRDAVFVTEEGPITGRQAIQQWHSDLYQWWQPKNRITKVDGNAPHLIGTAGNELWATGEWRETGQGKNGEPIPAEGCWLCIYVREGDDWKIRLDAWNTHPDSVILIHHSFAPQSAEPSSTASPTTAQQKDLADPETIQSFLAGSKAVEEAEDNHDAAAVAACYTSDAVFVTPGEGSITGRQAIQKWNTSMFDWWHAKNHVIKIDGNAVHLIGTGGNELWATGEWSETGQGKNGEPIPARAIGQIFMFVRAMIGRTGWASLT